MTYLDSVISQFLERASSAQNQTFPSTQYLQQHNSGTSNHFFNTGTQPHLNFNEPTLGRDSVQENPLLPSSSTHSSINSATASNSSTNPQSIDNSKCSFEQKDGKLCIVLPGNITLPLHLNLSTVEKTQIFQKLDRLKGVSAHATEIMAKAQKLISQSAVWSHLESPDSLKHLISKANRLRVLSLFQLEYVKTDIYFLTLAHLNKLETNYVDLLKQISATIDQISQRNELVQPQFQKTDQNVKNMENHVDAAAYSKPQTSPEASEKMPANSTREFSDKSEKSPKSVNYLSLNEKHEKLAAPKLISSNILYASKFDESNQQGRSYMVPEGMESLISLLDDTTADFKVLDCSLYEDEFFGEPSFSVQSSPARDDVGTHKDSVDDIYRALDLQYTGTAIL